MRKILIAGQRYLSKDAYGYKVKGVKSTRYICLAVAEKSIKKSFGSRNVRLVQEFIQDRLDGETCVESWLYKQDIPNKSFLILPSVVQSYRERWMKSLVQEIDESLKE